MDLIIASYLRLEDYIRAGGTVMAPLVVVSMVMWFLIVDRLLFFKRLNHKDMSLGAAWEHLQANRIPDLGESSGIAPLLVVEFISKRSGNGALDRFILDEIVLALNRSMSDYLSLIGVLAGIAPLLGLLGTVTGMITTFDVLAVFGTGNAKGMAAGISESLITTQTGLLVAIPGLYMKCFLDRRARNLQRRITAAGCFLRRHI